METIRTKEELEQMEEQQVKRVELLNDKWKSDPEKLLTKAKDEGQSLADYLESLSPASAGSPKSAGEFILQNSGIKVDDTDGTPGTFLKGLKEGITKKYADLTITEKLLDDVLYNKYKAAISSGMTTRERAMKEREIQKLQMRGPIPAGSARAPYTDVSPYPATPRAAVWTITDILAAPEVTLPTGELRVNRNTNVLTELQYQRGTEGAQPHFIRLADEQETLTTDSYRIAIEYTDQFLNNNLYSVADLANVFEEIGVVEAIDRRREGVRAILEADGFPADVAAAGGTGQGPTNTHVAGTITYNEWNIFIKGFGDIFMPDMVIGSPSAIAKFDAMTAGHNYNLVTRNSAGVPTGNSLNGNPLNVTTAHLNLGASGDKAALPKLNDNKLLVFQRGRVLYMYTTAGGEQDETERTILDRITSRVLSTDYAFNTRYIGPNGAAKIVAM